MSFFSNNSKTNRVDPLQHIDNIANSLNAGRKYTSEVKGEGVWEKYESEEYSRRCKVEARRNLVIWSR